MREGKIVEEFDVKGKEGGKKLHVVFRYPSRKDLRAALRLVNSVRDEAEYLGKRCHETLKTERCFIETQIGNIKKRKGIFLFVEVDGKLVGDTVIEPPVHDVSGHVGRLGIMLKEEFTSLGMGTRLMRKIIELARKGTRFKIIESGYFSRNARSRKLHRRFGFKQYGRFPKECRLRNGGYCDHIYVYKSLKKL